MTLAVDSCDAVSVQQYCRWCGRTFHNPDGTAMYCSHTHRKKMGHHRRRMAEQPIQRCPHPGKAVYTHRGDAIRASHTHRIWHYLCQCGVYHLTSKHNRAAAHELANYQNRTGNDH